MKKNFICSKKSVRTFKSRIEPYFLSHAERGKTFWIREFLAGMRLCRACGATPFRLPIPIFNFGGGGEIRTLDALRHAAFPRRWNKPLSDASKGSICDKQTRARAINSFRPGYPLVSALCRRLLSRPIMKVCRPYHSLLLPLTHSPHASRARQRSEACRLSPAPAGKRRCRCSLIFAEVVLQDLHSYIAAASHS